MAEAVARLLPLYEGGAKGHRQAIADDDEMATTLGTNVPPPTPTAQAAALPAVTSGDSGAVVREMESELDALRVMVKALQAELSLAQPRPGPPP